MCYLKLETLNKIETWKARPIKTDMKQEHTCIIKKRRVYQTLNALYALCKMFSESHAPGIQTLTNESMQFKYLIVGMALSASE